MILDKRRHFYLISTSGAQAVGPADEAKAAEALAILDAPIGGGTKKRGMGGMGGMGGIGGGGGKVGGMEMSEEELELLAMLRAEAAPEIDRTADTKGELVEVEKKVRLARACACLTT